MSKPNAVTVTLPRLPASLAWPALRLDCAPTTTLALPTVEASSGCAWSSSCSARSSTLVALLPSGLMSL